MLLREMLKIWDELPKNTLKCFLFDGWASSLIIFKHWTLCQEFHQCLDYQDWDEIVLLLLKIVCLKFLEMLAVGYFWPGCVFHFSLEDLLQCIWVINIAYSDVQEFSSWMSWRVSLRISMSFLESGDKRVCVWKSGVKAVTSWERGEDTQRRQGRKGGNEALNQETAVSWGWTCTDVLKSQYSSGRAMFQAFPSCTWKSQGFAIHLLYTGLVVRMQSLWKALFLSSLSIV